MSEDTPRTINPTITTLRPIPFEQPPPQPEPTSKAVRDQGEPKS